MILGAISEYVLPAAASSEISKKGRGHRAKDDV